METSNLFMRNAVVPRKEMGALAEVSSSTDSTVWLAHAQSKRQSGTNSAVFTDLVIPFLLWRLLPYRDVFPRLEGVRFFNHFGSFYD
jgi:hypothetical protein